MQFSSRLKQLAPELRSLQKDPNAEPFLDLMSDGFIWSDERLHGLSTEEMGSLRAIFRFRTSLITGDPDPRFENLWKELCIVCPEWIGFDASRCSPNETLISRYRISKKKSPFQTLNRLMSKSSSVSIAGAKRQSVVSSLLLRARRAVNTTTTELDQLDMHFHKYLEHGQTDLALNTLEKIAELIPCRGGFWRDLERAALAMGLNDRAKYFRSRFLGTHLST